ncbi:MAG: hypothetical protein AAFV78_09265 [Bacteroidota bacterium]
MRKLSENKGLIINQTVELELLISVTIVFASFQFTDWVEGVTAFLYNNNIYEESVIAFSIAFVGIFSSILLPLSVGVHFILRVYWLALISLKASFDKQRKQQITLKSPYNKIMAQNLGTDKQIYQIDQISSSLFAFSFLMLFVFAFFLLAGITFSWLIIALFRLTSAYVWLESMLIVMVILLAALALLNAIDFITLGTFRRSKKAWVRKGFYPIYRFFGWMTFSFLYRGVYYQLMRKIPRRILMGFILIFVIVPIAVTGGSFRSNVVIPTDRLQRVLDAESDIVYNQLYEENFREHMPIYYPYIPQYHIARNQHHMPLSIPMSTKLEEFLLDTCENVVSYDKRGFVYARNSISFRANDSTRKAPRKFMEDAMACFDQHLTLYLDGQLLDQTRFYFHTHNEYGRLLISTMIALDSISPGHHYLRLTGGAIVEEESIDIPFFKD